METNNDLLKLSEKMGLRGLEVFVYFYRDWKNAIIIELHKQDSTSIIR
jgi:hypothetical protein